MSEWMAPVFLNSALFFFECLYFAFPDPMEWWNSTGGLQEAWRDKLAASMHWCCTFGFPVPFFCAHLLLLFWDPGEEVQSLVWSGEIFF
jgi:hypothetical protein